MDKKLSSPLSTLQWVDRDRVKPNDYNPNKVSKQNLELLKQSILTNGWTLPIVVRPDFTIIDGFHRWTVAGEEPLKSMLEGKVPVVIVEHKDKAGNIYGTVTHNRATFQSICIMNNNLTANAISIPVSFTHNCAYLFSADILLIHFSSIMCNDDWFALVTLQRFLVKDILRQSEFPPCASIIILILKYATCSHNWVIYKIAFICVIKVSVLQNSKTNAYCKKMYEKMKKNGKGFFPVTVKDLVGNEKFSASTGWITILNRIPTSLQVLILSIIICVTAFFAYISYAKITFVWYYLVAVIFASFIVAIVCCKGWEYLITIWKRFYKPEDK